MESTQEDQNSRVLPREELQSPERLESPQENQISRESSREKEPVPERPKKKVSWPPENDLEKVEEVSKWMSDAWGQYKHRWKWIDGKLVEEGWVKETEAQTPSNPPAKESEIEVLGADGIHNLTTRRVLRQKNW